MRIVHNIKKDDIVEEVDRSMQNIYAALDNGQADYQSHMIEVEGKIDNQPIAILIDSGASHSYIDPNMVDKFKLERCKHEKSWLVQLDTRTKRKMNELVKDYVVKMNGVSTKAVLKIIPLRSYDCLIGMDWLEKHHIVLDCYNKAFTCLDEDGNSRTIQGIPMPISFEEISTLQLKRSYRKGCQIYVTHLEEITKDEVTSLEEYPILKEYEVVFGDFP
jgi:predicted aspartyl protease